jgi:hypothetical protein
MSPKPQPNLVLRTAVPEDSPACGQICYDAFSTLSGAHGFPCDFPGPEAAIGVLSMMFSTPGFYVRRRKTAPESTSRSAAMLRLRRAATSAT